MTKGARRRVLKTIAIYHDKKVTEEGVVENKELLIYRVAIPNSGTMTETTAVVPRKNSMSRVFLNKGSMGTFRRRYAPMTA